MFAVSGGQLSLMSRLTVLVTLGPAAIMTTVCPWLVLCPNPPNRLNIMVVLLVLNLVAGLLVTTILVL